MSVAAVTSAHIPVIMSLGPVESPEIVRDPRVRAIVPVKAAINSEIVEKCRKFVLANFERINKREDDKELHFYQGKHCTVFSHVDMPGLILKIMGDNQAQDSKANLDRTHKLFAERNFRYCHAPQAELAKLPDDCTVFVMEKAKGELNEHLAQNMIDEEFERIDTDAIMAEKWKTMTQEMAEAIATVGYWDTSLRNIIYDPERGCTFVDFEKAIPSQYTKGWGLSRLVTFFPPQFIDLIYDVADREQVKLHEKREDGRAARQAAFDLSRSCSRWDKKKSLPRVLDKDKWPPASWERRILDKFDENRQCSYKNYLPAKTQLFWQPLSHLWHPEETGKERAAFDAALETLQKEEIVLTWRTEENTYQRFLVSYTIYF